MYLDDYTRKYSMFLFSMIHKYSLCIAIYYGFRFCFYKTFFVVNIAYIFIILRQLEFYKCNCQCAYAASERNNK